MEERPMRDMVLCSINIESEEHPLMKLEVVANDEEKAMHLAKEWFDEQHASKKVAYRLKQIQTVKANQEVILVYPYRPA